MQLSLTDRLALNLASSPGEFALLLGSGISRSAGIPTGWEVTLDLIRQIAGINGESPEIVDLPAWFQEKYEKPARYSDVLEMAGSTQQARQRLVARYFEPLKDSDDEERKPTKAHRAIAGLVKEGFVRVIITTNFDRLMESALEEAGIAPVVLASQAQFQGATPIHRNVCTIIKVHGDYLDEGILNIDEELGSYPQSLDSLLDRVFDEYGVIFSGWSADYDIALRSAIERRVSRRYLSVWTHRGELSELAKRLVSQQAIVTHSVEDADSFFSELHSKTKSASELSKAQPESIDLLIASSKRALKASLPLIDYRDLIIKTTKGLINDLRDAEEFSSGGDKPTKEEFSRRAEWLWNKAAPLRRIIALGVFYRDADVAEAVSTAYQTILSFVAAERGGYTIYLALRKQIPISLQAVIGLASIGSESFISYQRILETKDPFLDGAAVAVGQSHSLSNWLENKEVLVGYENRKTAASDYVFERLTDDLGEIFPSPESAEAAFDQFEVMSAFLHVLPAFPVSSSETAEPVNAWMPWGRFTWKRGMDRGNPIWKAYRDRLERQGKEAPEIKAGLFHGDIHTALVTIDRHSEAMAKMAQQMYW